MYFLFDFKCGNKINYYYLYSELKMNALYINSRYKYFFCENGYIFYEIL